MLAVTVMHYPPAELLRDIGHYTSMYATTRIPRFNLSCFSCLQDPYFLARVTQFLRMIHKTNVMANSRLCLIVLLQDDNSMNCINGVSTFSTSASPKSLSSDITPFQFRKADFDLLTRFCVCLSSALHPTDYLSGMATM
jgi:hypothetical protein